MAWWIFQNAVVTAVLAAACGDVAGSSASGPSRGTRSGCWCWSSSSRRRSSCGRGRRPIRFGLAGRCDARARRLAAPPWRCVADARNADRPARLPPRPQGIAATTSASATRGAAHAPRSSGAWLLGVWAAGSLGLLGLEGMRVARLARRVRARRGRPIRRLSRASTSCRRRSDSSRSRCVVVDGHASPMVWCFGRTRLLWPEDLDDRCHRRLHRRTDRA